MKLTSPFHAKHVARGARMQSLKDWWMPSFYTSIETEYWNVRRGAGFVDYSFQSAVTITGPDAAAFLQRMIVNDIRRLLPGRAQYTNILEPSGKFVDETVVFRLDEDRFVINGSPVPRKHHLLALLHECSTGLEVTITDQASCMLAVQGPKARLILAQALDIAALPFMSVKVDRLDDLSVLVARAGYSGELGYEIYVQPAEAGRLWDRLVALGRDEGLAPYGIGVTALLAVEKGLLAPTDFYAGSTPLELGLSWTVAFDKGEFNGRAELLRRRDDGLQTKLMGFEVDDFGVHAAPGMRLFQGARPVGSVTHRNLYGPSIRRNVGRCWVESSLATVATELELEYQGERKSVTLTGHRHYDPDGARLRG